MKNLGIEPYIVQKKGTTVKVTQELIPNSKISLRSLRKPDKMVGFAVSHSQINKATREGSTRNNHRACRILEPNQGVELPLTLPFGDE